MRRKLRPTAKQSPGSAKNTSPSETRFYVMGVTRTVKNKHAANGSGIKGSKLSKNGPQNDGVIKAKKGQSKAPQIGGGLKGRPNIKDILKKRKKRVYTEKELGIPELNKITPVGVEKPKGKKKGKIFVDDRVRCQLPPTHCGARPLLTCSVGEHGNNSSTSPGGEGGPD